MLNEHPLDERVGCPPLSAPRVTVTERETLLAETLALPESLICGLDIIYNIYNNVISFIGTGFFFF